MATLPEPLKATLKRTENPYGTLKGTRTLTALLGTLLGTLLKDVFQACGHRISRASLPAQQSTRPSLPLVSREWKIGSNSSYNCTPFPHSLLTKGKHLGLALR